MSNTALNKLSLFANLFSIVVSVSTYSLVATNSETARTIAFTLATLLASFVGSKYVSQYLRNNGQVVSAGEDTPIALARIVALTPLVLCAYEVLSLVWLNADPGSVGWAHIAAASTAGYNIESVYGKDPSR